MHPTTHTTRLWPALILATLLVLAGTLPAQAMPAVTVRGYAWIDTNCDGLRDDTEPAANTVMRIIYLYSFGMDGLAFTADDRQIQTADIYSHAPSIYEFTRGAIGYRFRLSIIQGTRPEGYLPTLYRQGNDPTRWSSLHANWTTGDPENGGFLMHETEAVDGGNIGIAPAACQEQWYPNHVALPLILR